MKRKLTLIAIAVALVGCGRQSGVPKDNLQLRMTTMEKRLEQLDADVGALLTGMHAMTSANGSSASNVSTRFRTTDAAIRSMDRKVAELAETLSRFTNSPRRSEIVPVAPYRSQNQRIGGY